MKPVRRNAQQWFKKDVLADYTHVVLTCIHTLSVYARVWFLVLASQVTFRQVSWKGVPGILHAWAIS